MSIKTKAIIIIVCIITLFALGGWLYYVDASGFDNKKQYMQAEQFYSEKKYQEAYVGFLKIRYFSKYRKIAVLKQALAAEKLGDWAIAETKYEKFLQNAKPDSYTARAEYSLAKSYYMNKHFEQAITAFLNIKSKSKISDYRIAADYFLGKISLEKNLITAAKKYYVSYIKNSPTGTYSLSIAYDTMNMVLSNDEAIQVAKIFLANQKYDEALVVLKDVPVAKCWTYLAIAYYYKNDYNKFLSLTNEGFQKYCSNINIEDLKSFTDFYLMMQKDFVKSAELLQKTSANKVIPDYFLFKKAQYLPQSKKIDVYREIIKKYPKSKYTQDCLVDIFFDFADKKQYYSAIKVGEIYLEKFAGTPQESQILFWLGKYLQKVHRNTDAAKYFSAVQEKYPDSYYAFRGSRAEQNSQTSWFFVKNMLPDKNDIEFPSKTISHQDSELTKLFLEVNDNTIWEEIPFENPVLRAWLEYKKGNVQKSVYLADKYIKDSKVKIPYDNPVWKLAFPIYFSDEINANCKMRNLDSFLMLSLIREESHFNEKARSSSNAIGLMQLLLPTASYIAEKNGLDLPDEYKLQNPKYNISLGTAYFAYVLDVVDKFPMYAIGGYNGGPNAMNKWRDKHKNITDLDEFVEKIPYPESKNYIKKVYRSRYNYSKVYGK